METILQLITDAGNPVLINTILAGLIASFSFGPVGSIIVTKRISYLIGAIAHSALGGIGIGIYLQQVHHIEWMGPYLGGVIFSILSAIIIGIIRMRYAEREDTLLGAIWSIGMALGLIFMAKTPGYIDPMNYLFGNILLITSSDLVIMGLTSIAVILLTSIFYNKLFAVAFDEEFSKIRGINADAFYIGMLVFSSLCIVLLIKVVGIILVMALFTIPPATANFFSRKLWQMMISSTIICMLTTIIGTLWSYYRDLPTGPMIILTASAAYLFCLVGRSVVGKTRAN